MAAKDRERGKALERTVAARFGGRRRRNGEGVGFDDCLRQLEDGSTEPLPISLECKAYATLQLRTDWIEQAIRNADDRPWAVVQRPKGSRRILATVDLDFLVRLCEAAGLTNQPEEEHDVAGSATP